ncbi:hypothetical protein ACEUAY_21605 [Aeromonas veronii]
MKPAFIVKQKGTLVLAKKNTIMGNEKELVSLYQRSKSMGWVIVADQVRAKNAHRATLKIHLLNDSHRVMLLACAINALLFFVVSNVIVNTLLALVSVVTYIYCAWSIYNSQSAMLRKISTQERQERVVNGC